MTTPTNFRLAVSAPVFVGTGVLALAVAVPAQAQYKRHVTHNLAVCNGDGPAVRISVSGVKSSAGTLRVQLYRLA